MSANECTRSLKLDAVTSPLLCARGGDATSQLLQKRSKVATCGTHSGSKAQTTQSLDTDPHASCLKLCAMYSSSLHDTIRKRIKEAIRTSLMKAYTKAQAYYEEEQFSACKKIVR